MSNVEFEKDPSLFYKSRKLFGEYEVPAMIRFLQTHKIVKNTAQAYYILIGLIVICIVGAGLILYSTFKEPDHGAVEVNPQFNSIINKATSR